MMHRSRQVKTNRLGDFEKQLLNDFQHGLPLSSRPYADMAEKLGVSEEKVISTLQLLQDQKLISRVGAVFRPNTVGASTLAAMAVAEHELDKVANLVSEYAEVNHNYEREHHFNLWFVLTAENETRLQEVITELEERTGNKILYLPMIEDYHIDLGFDMGFDTGFDTNGL